MADRHDSAGAANQEEWQQFLKDYLDDVHRYEVDQGYERIWPFWKEGKERESLIWRQWQRWEEQLQERGALTTAVRGRAIPLFWMEKGREVQLCMAWKVQRWYNLKGETGVEEVRKILRVTLTRTDAGWCVENVEESNGDGALPDETEEETITLAEAEGNPLPTLIVHGAGGYDTERAIAYAERYWDSANPAYPLFTDNCTNFISQCLHAGGIPMLFSREMGKGWWMRGSGKGASWSYSWSVAHSLYLLLKSGGPPMRAVAIPSVDQLEPGDIICYDFDGDGRYQHNTIVVAKDANNMPLVNANTTNSRLRYWDYRDSTAYTPQIRYAFFRIRGT
ncbi:amidase domain-containing protein [Brevibacillus borstelensis]|uniref:amidase domain-containing protein n=1 Tax=Brevibacillus borstelensis TaxID=45462 RepID=UPI0030C18BEF